MNTQEAVDTLYEAEDALRGRIPTDEERIQALTAGLATLQKYCNEIIEEINKLKE